MKKEESREGKQALLVVSFGTSYPDAEKSSIVPVENSLKSIFRDFEICRAFTSRKIIKKLASKGRHVPLPNEAVSRLAREGFTHVIVQPLHFLPGFEYELKIIKPLESWKERFEGFCVGRPLLESDRDLEEMVQIIAEMSLRSEGNLILFMGHGTEHSADITYQKIQEILDEKGINALVGTVEGKRSLESLLPEIEKRQQDGIRPIELYPLMLVAGDHARNDMAGDDESWKNTLESLGYKVIPHLQGMGSLFSVRRMFIRHVRECKKVLYPERYARMRRSREEWKLKTLSRGTDSSTAELSPDKIGSKKNWHPRVDYEKCIGCGLCFLYCHRDVYSFAGDSKTVKVVNPENCVENCSHCSRYCPVDALIFPA